MTSAYRAFMPTPAAPRLCRRFVHEMLVSWKVEELDGVAALLASELVANVVRHVHSEIGVGIGWDGTKLTVDVSDASPRRPELRDNAGPTGGYGLRIVAALAHEWGVSTSTEGKVVWFTLEYAFDASDAPRVTADTFGREVVYKSSLLTISVARRAEVVVVEISGETDMSLAADRARIIERVEPLIAPAQPDHVVVVDVSAVSFLDSTGIALLLALKEKVDGDGAVMIVRHASPTLVQVLRVSGLQDLIDDR